MGLCLHPMGSGGHACACDPGVERACRIPLRLKVRASRLEGTLLAWVPPPPGDRLWSAFVKLPHLDLNVNPVVRGGLQNTGPGIDHTAGSLRMLSVPQHCRTQCCEGPPANAPCLRTKPTPLGNSLCRHRSGSQTAEGFATTAVDSGFKDSVKTNFDDMCRCRCRSATGCSSPPARQRRSPAG